jgi:hypothetical protein
VVVVDNLVVLKLFDFHHKKFKIKAFFAHLMTQKYIKLRPHGGRYRISDFTSKNFSFYMANSSTNCSVTVSSTFSASIFVLGISETFLYLSRT